MTHSGHRPTVLLTDRAWPDAQIEEQVLDAAGIDLVEGPAEPAPAARIEQLAGHHAVDAILTCWAPVTAGAIAASAGLQLVARMGVGLDNIDVAAATDRGVLVTNVPDYCIDEVSDHAVAMVLAWTRGLVLADRQVRAGRWDPAAARLRRLRSLTCGIVGFGRIGQATGSKLAAFGAQVLVSDPHPPPPGSDVEAVGFEDLLARSDVVILHAPLNRDTHHLVGQEQLTRMRPGALLVNVSRGGLVDSAAVAEALFTGHLSAAALDVLESEPDVPPSLRGAEGTILTPHIAFSSDESVAQLRRSAAEEAVRVLTGHPALHPCNDPVPAAHLTEESSR